MIPSVWADVGGTFTDCFVVDENGQRATKVLSTGLVYASTSRRSQGQMLTLDAIPAANIDGFWVGAKVASIGPDGTAIPLGTIVDQHQTRITLDCQPLPLASISRGDRQRHEVNPASDDTPGRSIQVNASLEAPVLATRILLGLPLSDSLPGLDVRLGTTRGTNALLTRSGAVSALVVTRGFADVLRIGEQDRPDLFDLAIKKPPPLTENVIEVVERLDAAGNVLIDVDVDRLRQDLVQLKNLGIQSLAICLLHSHVNDRHERIVERIAQRIGFAHISRSSEVAPLIKLVSRAETTTLDAYLSPILSGYAQRVWQQFGGQHKCRLRLMTSSGNLVTPQAFRGRDSILSGPAGGVVALAHVAQRANAPKAIGLDMGGTSTDVSRFEGHVGRRFESRVAGVRVMTPMMDIQTVAAGGGSICDCVDGRLIVGPSSAGADPGPACYGRGGPLTVTDLNLLLGRIPTSRFPFALDLEAAGRRLAEIAKKLPTDSLADLESLAEGFLNIAVTHMSEAVRTVSTAQGSDVREMTLVGFGGAAGQHLCRVASALGIRRILDHPDAGMLSALGMGLADVGRVVTHGVYRPLNSETIAAIGPIVAELHCEADDLLQEEHDGHTPVSYRWECDARYQGTESSLTLPLDPRTTLPERFHSAHQDTFGYAQVDRQVELVAIRCDATLRSALLSYHSTVEPSNASDAPNETIRLWHAGQWVEATLIDRKSVRLGQRIAAPAMVVGDHSTLLIEPNWNAKVIEDRVIELTPTATARNLSSPDAVEAASDPVLLEVISRRLQGIADAMGEVLRRTAISVNVKERRDYSCAVFRGDGSLVANAPHVPVHLGAMGHTVRHLMKIFPSMSAGDCFVSNDPFAGGSHLPDVTLVTPVFCENSPAAGKPDFFVASRAHHAEIGGRTPGSMPPEATSLAEEGVLIREFPLVRSGVSQENSLRQLLSSGPYPSRSVDENLADIAAQQAAGVHGARAMRELAAIYTTPVVDALMNRLLDVAGDSMSRWIKTLPSEAMRFTDSLDDGTPIAVELQRVGQRLSIAFDPAPIHRHGFNATPAIVTAAVLYVLRSVSGSNLPLCDGVLRDVELKISPGLLDPPANLDPTKCAAVVAGNVETSQRIVDVLLGALGVAAASQGTMNNVLIGDHTFGYYETIGGGSGATADHDGADAVHTHMTNTRITDPEILESRLPVRLHRFAVRRRSGGAGRHRGGDGIVREFEFLKPLIVSLLTGRRTTSPYGACGGMPGKPGRNLWVTSSATHEVSSTATIHVGIGDRLLIKTPGGGGWGT